MVEIFLEALVFEQQG
jgi:hypothetical protein